MHSRQIESFVETANAGSFNKAAKSLYISTPSLIQQIDLLEARVGAVLFERSRKGVKPTEAGESLYRDAVELIRLSKEAVDRAHQIHTGEGTIRVASSMLMKCRLLPNIWSKVLEEAPDTRIDIISLERAGVEPGGFLAGLGVSYDVMEGLYLSDLYRDACLFLELERAPICLAVPKTIDASGIDVVDSDLLEGLDIVTLESGISSEYDSVRTYLASLGTPRFHDVPFYTMGVFADCELNNRAIVTNTIWADIHPDLVCVPLAEPHEIPYGLILPKRPSKPVMRLYNAAKSLVVDC